MGLLLDRVTLSNYALTAEGLDDCMDAANTRYDNLHFSLKVKPS